MSQPVCITWNRFDSEEVQEAIDDFLTNQACKLLEWEGREVAEWLLSNYGIAPSSPETTDEQVVHALIVSAIQHHLQIDPSRYEFTIDKLGAMQ